MVYAKRRSRNCWEEEEADFGMNEFPSGGSKLSYRGIRHPASFHSPLNSRSSQFSNKCNSALQSRSQQYPTKYFTASFHL